MKKRHEEYDDPIDLNALAPLPKGEKRDSEYYRALFERVHFLMEDAIRRGVPTTGHGQMITAIKEMCMLSGVDYERIADTRTDAQVVEDTIRMVVEAPEKIMELPDRELTLMRTFFETAALDCEEAASEKSLVASRGGHVKPLTKQEVAAFRRRGKTWLDLLEKMRKVREMVRAKSWSNNKSNRQEILTSRLIGEEATWPLRIMLYVGRTSVKDMGADGTSLFRISGRRHKRGKQDVGHHVWMALSYWTARNEAYFFAGGAQRGVLPYEGVMCVLPPAHSKTELGLYERAARYVEKPETMTIILHAKAVRAQSMLGYLAEMFDPKQPSGRRMRALFPHLPNFDGKPTAQLFDFKLPISRKGNTARAAGAGERDSGADATELYIDDPLDQDTAWHETERDKTHERIHGTWMTRLRGHSKFWVWNTTLWHDDDASCRMIRMLEQKQKLFVLYLDGAGGPEESFEPVWPESPYTAQYFKGKYETDRRNYMTIYGCDPKREGTKMVRKLALYAVKNPDGTPNKQHEEFVRSSSKALSIDPTTTDNATSDDTGIVYGAVGDIRIVEEGGVRYRKVARVLSALRLHNKPNDVIDFVAYFAERNQVHNILIEWTTGSVLMVRDLRAKTAVNVVPCQPGVRGVGLVGKEARLISVQTMLDDSLREKGLRAVVEWPGVWKKGGAACEKHPGAALLIDEPVARCSVCQQETDRLVIHPDVQWLSDQILRFGTTSDDGVDATTQWCQFIKADVNHGESGTIVAAKARPQLDERLQAMYDRMKNVGKPTSCWSREALVIGS